MLKTAPVEQLELESVTVELKLIAANPLMIIQLFFLVVHEVYFGKKYLLDP